MICIFELKLSGLSLMSYQKWYILESNKLNIEGDYPLGILHMDSYIHSMCWYYSIFPVLFFSLQNFYSLICDFKLTLPYQLNWLIGPSPVPTIPDLFWNFYLVNWPMPFPGTCDTFPWHAPFTLDLCCLVVTWAVYVWPMTHDQWRLDTSTEDTGWNSCSFYLRHLLASWLEPMKAYVCWHFL